MKIEKLYIKIVLKNVFFYHKNCLQIINKKTHHCTIIIFIPLHKIYKKIKLTLMSVTLIRFLLLSLIIYCQFTNIKSNDKKWILLNLNLPSCTFVRQKLNMQVLNYHVPLKGYFYILKLVKFCMHDII